MLQNTVIEKRDGLKIHYALYFLVKWIMSFRTSSFLCWDFPLLGQRHFHRSQRTHAAHWEAGGGSVRNRQVFRTFNRESDFLYSRWRVLWSQQHHPGFCWNAATWSDPQPAGRGPLCSLQLPRCGLVVAAVHSGTTVSWSFSHCLIFPSWMLPVLDLVAVYLHSWKSVIGNFGKSCSSCVHLYSLYHHHEPV